MAARRVIIVGPAYPLRGGGMATFNERLAYAFQEAGDEVEIVTFSLQYPSFLFPGKSQYSDEPAPPGLRIKVLITSVNPLSWWGAGRLSALGGGVEEQVALAAGERKS